MTKLNLDEIVEVSQRALSDYELKGWTEEQNFIARARTWLPMLVAELRQAREELEFEKSAHRGAVLIGNDAIHTMRQELEQARAERDTLAVLLPLYYVVDDYLHHEGTNDYPADHCNPDQLAALRETFLGISVDAVEEEDTMEKTELKPCPFCGSEARYRRYDISGEHYIECPGCAIVVMFDVDLDEKGAIEHWNTRRAVFLKMSMGTEGEDGCLLKSL